MAGKRKERKVRKMAYMFRATAIEKVTYSRKAGRLENLRITFKLSDENRLYAFVEKFGSCPIEIIRQENGKCGFCLTFKGSEKADARSRDARQDIYSRLATYIETVYGITGRGYDAIHRMVREGERIMSKAERQAAKAGRAKVLEVKAIDGKKVVTLSAPVAADMAR